MRPPRIEEWPFPGGKDYVAGGEPLDKAGAYGLQGRGQEFVERVEGDPETVVGMRVRLLRDLLEDLPDR